MSQVLKSSITPKIESFLIEFGDDLDTCNPTAYDLLQEIMSAEEKDKLLEDFVWDYADELDACQPDAFEALAAIFEQYGISML